MDFIVYFYLKRIPTINSIPYFFFFKKALSFEVDRNKQCNLAICLMQMNRITEAKFLLQAVSAASKNRKMDDSFAKSFERASQMLI